MKTIEEILIDYDRYIKTCAFNFNQIDYYDELVQEGKIGLWKAHTNYDSSTGPFHSYALTYIRGHMMSYLTKNGRTVKLPADKVIATLKSEERYNQKVHLDEYDFELEEEMVDDDIDDETFNRNKAIQRALAELSDRHRYIVSNYLGLDLTIDKMTFKEIGDVLGITKEATRQQYNNALKKLKNVIIL